MDTDALITNRDGIVGSREVVAATPKQHLFENPDNLELWDSAIRAQIFDFELHSRIGFATDPAAQHASVWHLEVASANFQAPQYRPLVEVVRPSEATFKQQLAFVLNYADLRPDRATEILTQVTVPNAFYGSIAFLHPARTRWTAELLFTALRLASFVELRLKHALSCRRPIEYSPQVQPIIPTPRHGSLPSGHATEAFIFAVVLGRLMRAAAATSTTNNPVYAEPAWAKQLMRQATRIAINRTVAGVHFPVDSATGAMLGMTLGNYMVSRCDRSIEYEAWKFDGAAFNPASDFDCTEFFDVANFSQKESAPATYASQLGDQAIAAPEQPTPLTWLWGKAKDEWLR